MYIKRKLKNTYINFQICEFLQPQNKGVKTAVKISVSTARIESRATDISLGRSKNIFFPDTGSIK